MLELISEKDEAIEQAVELKSVSTSILVEFLDALEKEVELAEIAPRLRKVVLDDRTFTETAIRAALFPEVP